MSRLMGTYAPSSVTFVKGSGCRLYDDAGRSYLDFFSGIAVTGLGHAHPDVADAICAQARTLLHVSNLFSNPLGAELSERIDALVSSAIERVSGKPVSGRVFLANSGTEANECAIKLARKWGQGRRTIISLEGGFHGRTLGSLSATHQPAKQQLFQPLAGGFAAVAPGDARALVDAFEEHAPVAVVVEVIQGESGVHEVPYDFLSEVRELCHRYGSLLVVDEVQTGLGRTGRWFAFEHAGVVPDVVTLAKSLGNGMPIGACWAREEVAEAFEPGDHGSTFGGQPLACSAALATLRVIEGEGLVGRAATAGERLAGSLGKIAGVNEVRGRGLLVGVGLEATVPAPLVARKALDAGLVVGAIGSSTLRITPPLIVTDEEIDAGVSLLAASLEAARHEAPEVEENP